MKVLLSAILILLILMGCTVEESKKGNGPINRSYFAIEEYSEVYCSHGCDITIHPSDSAYAIVEIDESLVDFLEIGKRGGCYYFSLNNRYHYENYTFRVHLYLPTLQKLGLSGRSTASLDSSLQVSQFNLRLSGASSFTGAICSNLFAVNASGGSELKVGGEQDEATVMLSGGSKGTISINRTISGTISGNSYLTCYGNPQEQNVATSGSSKVVFP